MIEVPDQYALKIDIAGKDDFLKESDFHQLIITEDAGNVVPAFQLSFILYDETLLSKLNEGNPISISFGASKDEMLTCKFTITKSVPIRVADGQYKITILGLHHNLDFSKTAKMEAYGTSSSLLSALEALKIVAAKYFKTDFSDERSADRQIWVCDNKSHQAFVNTLWLHGDYKDSVACIGITCDGTFVCKNIKTAVKAAAASPISEAKIFKFMPAKIEDAKWDIVYDQYKVKTNTSISNSSIGYPKTQPTFSLAAGELLSTIPTVKNALAMAKPQNKSNVVGSRPGAFRPVSENMHARYHECEANNNFRLSALSAISVYVGFMDLFRPIRILDIVYFKEDSMQNPGEAQESNTGYYVVSRVTRSISKRRMSTSIKLNREAVNLMKGSEL